MLSILGNAEIVLEGNTVADSKYSERPTKLVDCHKEHNATEERCVSRNCCWDISTNPDCFNSSSITTPKGMLLRKANYF